MVPGYWDGKKGEWNGSACLSDISPILVCYLMKIDR